MELLDKFDAITVSTENQISENDRRFCAAQQAAYDNARGSLAELLFIWEDMLEQQKSLLAGTGRSARTYISADSSVSVSKGQIERTIYEMHKEFIREILHYFTRTYHFSLSEWNIMVELLPKKPEWRYGPEYEQDLEKFEEEKARVALSYEDILALLFKELGGRSLSEYAVFQMKDDCWASAWRDATPKFERDKHTIKLLSATNSDFEIYDGTKKIMKALAYFETQTVEIVPHELSPFFYYNGPRDNIFDFEELTKVSKIRLYKNGRLDIRFVEEAYAVQFATDYLGTMPWKEACR